MMTNFEKAKSVLAGGIYTCVLCRGDETYTSTKPGINPMVDFITAGTNLSGAYAADRIVGRAAALLFCLAGVSGIYAGVLSDGAAQILESHEIKFSCGERTANIINRAGTGICPMEQAVAGIDDPHDAYIAILKKLKELKATPHNSLQQP